MRMVVLASIIFWSFITKFWIDKPSIPQIENAVVNHEILFDAIDTLSVIGYDSDENLAGARLSVDVYISKGPTFNSFQTNQLLPTHQYTAAADILLSVIAYTILYTLDIRSIIDLR